MRWFVLALAFAFCADVTLLAGCAGPYSGAPEKLKKPRKKRKPDDAEASEGEQEVAAQMDEKCRTNFYDKPTDRRKPRESRALAGQADSLLLAAEDKEGGDRVVVVKDALSKLTNALKQDPYGPEATYKMAVAYALVGKKGCSLRLLERLVELQKHPDVASETDRTIKRALNDIAFDPFRKEADTALGH